MSEQINLTSKISRCEACRFKKSSDHESSVTLLGKKQSMETLSLGLRIQKKKDTFQSCVG